MAIEDYIDEAQLYIDKNSMYEYRKNILEDIGKWKKRHCIDCWWDMKISAKWNLYCSRICWDKEVEAIQGNINLEESIYEKF